MTKAKTYTLCSFSGWAFPKKSGVFQNYLCTFVLDLLVLCTVKPRHQTNIVYFFRYSSMHCYLFVCCSLKYRRDLLIYNEGRCRFGFVIFFFFLLRLFSLLNMKQFLDCKYDLVFVHCRRWLFGWGHFGCHFCLFSLMLFFFFRNLIWETLLA